MAWRRPGDKPLSEPMMVSSLTHVYIYASLGFNKLTFLHTYFSLYILSVQDMKPYDVMLVFCIIQLFMAFLFPKWLAFLTFFANLVMILEVTGYLRTQLLLIDESFLADVPMQGSTKLQMIVPIVLVAGFLFWLELLFWSGACLLCTA